MDAALLQMLEHTRRPGEVAGIDASEDFYMKCGSLDGNEGREFRWRRNVLRIDLAQNQY